MPSRQNCAAPIEPALNGCGPAPLVTGRRRSYKPALIRIPRCAWRSSIEEPPARRFVRGVTKDPAMAVPKRKTSPSRRGMRRSADALKAPTYVEDKDSGELRRPHHIDLKTGMYRGRQVLKVKSAEA
ncbi:hypothetical protein MRA01_48330 [Methylobacterium radiotolerans]|nr:hypothetical protein MRA01_48330 [Methylobacterium radiotolerans]